MIDLYVKFNPTTFVFIDLVVAFFGKLNYVYQCIFYFYRWLIKM